MKNIKTITILLVVALSIALGFGIYNGAQPTMGLTPGPGEPSSLQDLVEYPETPGDTMIIRADDPTIAIDQVTSTPDWGNITDALGKKGYTFNLTTAIVEDVNSGSLGGFFGYLVSAWSTETGPNGARAFIIGMYEFSTPSAMVVGGITNLLPPDQVPEVDPFIIVNAMPYLYIRWYWYAWSPIDTVVTWHYWWYDSHSHPNWYWGCYWWWRNYIAYYWEGPGFGTWVPWWWWFWHIVYWRNWNWWSTYFPY